MMLENRSVVTLAMTIKDRSITLEEGKGAQLLVILTEDVKGTERAGESILMTLVTTAGEEGPSGGRGRVRERKEITGGKNDQGMTHTLIQTKFLRHTSLLTFLSG